MTDTERLAALLQSIAAIRYRLTPEQTDEIAARLIASAVRVEDAGQEIHDVTCPDCAPDAVRVRGAEVLLDVNHEEDGSWSVGIRALPGHVGCADTLSGAYAEAHDAALAWVEATRGIDPDRLARALDKAWRAQPWPPVGERPNFDRDLAAAIVKAYEEEG